MQDWLEAVELISLGGFLMPNIGEYPSAGVESSLWQVMEGNAPVKYYLSKKACEGIIRRAENRDKTLPKLLETALLYRIATADNETKANSSGEYAPNDNNTNGIIPTYSPAGHKCEGESKTMYGLCSNSSNSMKSANPYSGIYKADTTRTLDSQGGNPSCNQGGMIIVESAQGSDICSIVILNDQGGESMTVEKADVSPTLRSETHGHLPIIAKEIKAVHESLAGDSVSISDIAYALRSGRKPLLLEEMRCETIGFDSFNSDLTGEKSATLGINCGMSTGRNGIIKVECEAAGFDAMQITSKHNRSSVEPRTPYPTLCKDSNPHIIEIHPDVAPTLTASAGGTSRPGGGQGSELDYYMAYAIQGNMIGRADHNGPQGNGINENNCFTLNATDQHAVAFFNHTHTHNPPKQGETASCQTARQYKKTPVDLFVLMRFINTLFTLKGFAGYQEGVGTLKASGGDLGGGSESLVTRELASDKSVTGTFSDCRLLKLCLDNHDSGKDEKLITELMGQIPRYIVRRLTPTECERLQGFPDHWTRYGSDSEKEISDTPRYQMLGNSIAIPCVRFIMKNIADMEKNINNQNSENNMRITTKAVK